MVKRLLLIVGLLSSITMFSREQETAFQYRIENAKELSLEQTKFRGEVEIPFSSVERIYSISVSGNVVNENKFSLSRVILIDKDGNEYLVFENRYFAQDKLEQSFSDVAFETAYLDGIVPKSIKVVTYFAEVDIEQILYSTQEHKERKSTIKRLLVERAKQQSDALSAKWNEHISKVNYLWYAETNELSIRSFQDKKLIFGATSDLYNTNGMEFYADGIFIIPVDSERITVIPDYDDVPVDFEEFTFVESFDWRNRHGRNWMTSVKDQTSPYEPGHGNGGCWIFGPVAAIESQLNLHYNQLLDYDLSEQEISSCAPSGSVHSGGYPNVTFQYVRNNGIGLESCFPFRNNDTISCEEKCSNPGEIITIPTYSELYTWNDDVVKRKLISDGPMVSGINNNWIRHVMCLCGYGTVHVGNVLQEIVDHASDRELVVAPNSPYLNKNYWIFKNSYGIGRYTGGYMYALFESDRFHAYTLYLNSNQVESSALSSDDIQITDNDNDGYYYWGLGPKPENCPVCVPDDPDGDDSNPAIGPINEYGRPIHQVLYINNEIYSSTTWNTDHVECGDLIIMDGSTLTVTSTLTMNPRSKIYVRNNSSLVVLGGTGCIVNAHIYVDSTSSLLVQNGGRLKIHSLNDLQIQSGGQFSVQNGYIDLR